jgi:outer membrane biosynthesis protein TonB
MGMVRRGGASESPYFWGGPTKPRSSLVTESSEASIQALLQQKIAEFGSAEKAYQAMKQAKRGTETAVEPKKSKKKKEKKQKEAKRAKKSKKKKDKDKDTDKAEKKRKQSSKKRVQSGSEVDSNSDTLPEAPRSKKSKLGDTRNVQSARENTVCSDIDTFGGAGEARNDVVVISSDESVSAAESGDETNLAMGRWRPTC